MVRCKDCKNKFNSPFRNDAPYCGKFNTTMQNDMSCIHGERTDGLRECCETCKHFVEDDSNNVECEKEIFDYINRAYVAFGALRCDNWQPRKGK